MSTELERNPGCLGAIARLFGIDLGSGRPVELPYRLRDDFLSKAELAFYRALCSATGERAVVLTKVNLADVFFVSRPDQSVAYRNKIDRKHVDFLLCEPASMRPIVGVELDDSTHQRPDRQERDHFVDSVFDTAGLPLLHVPVRAAISISYLSDLLEPHLGQGCAPGPSNAQPADAKSASHEPTCAKCGIPMILRTASRGGRAGEQFWGCPNYPRCRQTLPLPGVRP